MPGETTEHRKLAAIMFTDMVGYSALAQRNEALALELLEEHWALLRPLFPRFNGTEIKTIGDAFLIEFHSALEAAQCAIEIQRTLAKRNHDVASERRIEIKIGIHIGDVVHRGGDVYGDGVNIASRIEPLAGAGGICVSMDVERQIRNALEARFEKLAPTELKNISVAMDLFRIVLPWEKDSGHPAEWAPSRVRGQNGVRTAAGSSSAINRSVLIVAFILLLSGAGWWWQAHPTASTTTQMAQELRRPSVASPGSDLMPASQQAASAERSIAVLAFANLSEDKNNEYFSDGISEELLNALAKIPNLKVCARTSAFFFKGKQVPIAQIARQLDVAYVVEGTVRKSGNRVRISAQLIKAADGFRIWSNNFDRELKDIFAVQDEIASLIAKNLSLKIGAGPDGVPIPTRGGTEDLEAYDLFLRGRELWNKRTAADIERAVSFFQEAADKDPSFAMAHAGVGSCFVLLPYYAGAPTREAMTRARAAAVRALRLESGLAEAQTVLAKCSDWEGEAVEADKLFRQALASNPNYATAHQWYAEFLSSILGQPERGLAEIRLAQALDPLSAMISCDTAELLWSNRRYEDALAQIERALELSPGFPQAYHYRGFVKLLQKRYSEAATDFEKARALGGTLPESPGLLGLCYASLGRADDARLLLEQTRSDAARGLPVLKYVALIYHGLGDENQTFFWLDQAATNSVEGIGLLEHDRLWDDVTSDLRFTALVRKHGLNK